MLKIHSQILNYLKTQKFFWLFFLISTGVLSTWLAAFYPGIMTPDSIDQWQQASTLSISNWHPYLSTLYIGLLKGIANTPASIAILQIIWTSILFAYAFNYFLQKGTSRWLVVSLFIILTTSIPVGLYTITLWKDIPFALALASAGFLVSKALFDKQSPNILGLLLFVTIASFFRHNGAINLFIFPIAIITLFYKQYRQKIFQFLSGLVIICFLVIVIIPSLLKIKEVPTWFTAAPIYYETVSYLKVLPTKDHPQRLSPKTIASLTKIMSLDHLLKSFDPQSAEPLLFSTHITPGALDETEIWSNLRKEFWRYNLLRNFNLFLSNRTTLFITSTLGYGAISANDIYPNNLGLKTTPLIALLNHWMGNISTFVGTNIILQHVIWNSLISIIAQVWIIINSWYKKKTASFFFSSLIITNCISIAAFNVAGDWRYYYFAYLSFFIIIPFFSMESRKHIN